MGELIHFGILDLVQEADLVEGVMPDQNPRFRRIIHLPSACRDDHGGSDDRVILRVKERDHLLGLVLCINLLRPLPVCDDCRHEGDDHLDDLNNL